MTFPNFDRTLDNNLGSPESHPIIIIMLVCAKKVCMRLCVVRGVRMFQTAACRSLPMVWLS